MLRDKCASHDKGVMVNSITRRAFILLSFAKQMFINCYFILCSSLLITPAASLYTCSISLRPLPGA